ncbi:MAG: IS66 family transposase [Deltaproteobacteria bacterium]|nr:IS66 family transposase [Deltaproteobacteria bacterium]
MLAELQAKAKATAEKIEKAKPKETAARKARSTTGPTPQPLLPIVEREFTLDDADRACPSCGGNLQPMKDQFDESEMIDVVEVRYELVKVKQQKYVCRCGGCVETALGPARALSGSRYSLAFAVKIIIDKWLDHIPLERQVRILERHGLSVSSSTLWDLAYAVTQELSPLSAALLDHVKRQPVIGLDQTSWPRLESDATKPWQMWCLTAPGVVVHRIRDDKSADTFADLVGDYVGTIVADALSTHGAGARAAPGISLAACWAHVFRRFDEAKSDYPDAERACAWIGALYELDRRAGGDPARLGEIRRSSAPEILDALREWLLVRAADTHLSIGKAAAYTLGIWDRLTLFVDDARIPLDNNATERAIRGPVVGRKNHLGSKSRRGTEVAATLYTILETAKLHDIDPSAYVTAAVEAARRGEVLLPWQFTPSS